MFDKTKIYQDLKTRFKSESDLTMSMMNRVISDLDIHDPAMLDNIYETVIYYTGDWPEHEGWGSSDSRICVNSVKAKLVDCGHLNEAA